MKRPEPPPPTPGGGLPALPGLPARVCVLLDYWLNATAALLLRLGLGPDSLVVANATLGRGARNTRSAAGNSTSHFSILAFGVVACAFSKLSPRRRMPDFPPFLFCGGPRLFYNTGTSLKLFIFLPGSQASFYEPQGGACAMECLPI